MLAWVSDRTVHFLEVFFLSVFIFRQFFYESVSNLNQPSNFVFSVENWGYVWEGKVIKNEEAIESKSTHSNTERYSFWQQRFWYWSWVPEWSWLKIRVISFSDELILFTSLRNINTDRLKLQFSKLDTTDKDELLTNLSRGNGCQLPCNCWKCQLGWNCFFESTSLGLFLDGSHHKMLWTAVAEWFADSIFLRENHGSKPNAGRSACATKIGICGAFVDQFCNSAASKLFKVYFAIHKKIYDSRIVSHNMKDTRIKIKFVVLPFQPSESAIFSLFRIHYELIMDIEVDNSTERLRNLKNAKGTCSSTCSSTAKPEKFCRKAQAVSPSRNNFDNYLDKKSWRSWNLRIYFRLWCKPTFHLPWFKQEWLFFVLLSENSRSRNWTRWKSLMFLDG